MYIKAEDIIIGRSYYVTSKYDCKSCYRVVVEEIINDSSVMVRATTTKNGKEPKVFSMPIFALHEKSKSAVHGYKQHHK